MDDELEFSEVFVNYNVRFTAIRVVDNRLIPTRWKLKTDVAYYEHGEDDEHKDDRYDFNIRVAFAKIQFWFDNVMDQALIFDRSNPFSRKAFLDEDGKQIVDNQLVLLPSEPDDATLARVLQSKMNALAGGHLRFGIAELSAEDDSGLSFIFTGDGELDLPDMDDWIGPRTYFTKPWWARGDASTVDTIPPEGADLNEVPAFAYSLNFIAESLEAPRGAGANIVRPEFRPQVIKGGRTEVE